MKKKKPPDKQQSDFRNKPFSSLKGHMPSTALPAIKSVTPQARQKNLSSNEDDATLFLRAAEGAKRVNPAPDEHEVSANERQRTEKAVVRGPDETRIFLSAMQKIGTTFHDPSPERELEDEERRSPTNRMRQLKRGTIRIGKELDLHGFLRDEAHMRLEHFIAAAFSGRQQAVLVITGKGINSPEGPVLRGAVAEWLRKNGKGLVVEFSPAPRALGGSGAFVVFLKRVD